MNQSYLCIDLKSYYASVECVDRGLDPSRRIWSWPIGRGGWARSASPSAPH